MVAMRGILPGILAMAVAAPGIGQQPNTTLPVRLCVAQLRNQTPIKLDVVNLRQKLIDGLNQTKLGKAGTMTVVPIEVSESEDALAAVQSQGCQFAVYIRLLLAPPSAPPVDVSGGVTYRSSPVDNPQKIMGLQCTVERTGNPVPALIDRQFTKTAMLPQDGIEKVLVAEVQRIADAIEKKMITPAK
jgi:hypothetical protein